MNKTKIEWAQNPDGTPGYTWNPITGCLNNCSYCYARKLANGRLKSRMLGNIQTAPGYTDYPFKLDPFYPRLWTDRYNDDVRVEPAAIHRPRGVFVCSMGDLFGQGVPTDWTVWILEFIRVHPFWRFYLLTKQPQNLAKWSPFPDNCWVGVSATGPFEMYKALDCLGKVDARVKYLSFEPLLQEIKIPDAACLSIVNWVIIGAQTKPTVIPEYEWVVEIVEAADKAGVPVFLKDSLNTCEISDYPLLLTANGNMRQEMPKRTH